MRTRLAEVLNRVAVAGDLLVVTRAKQPMGALVPMKDFRLLVKLADLVYVEEARASLRETETEAETEDEVRTRKWGDLLAILWIDPTIDFGVARGYDRERRALTLPHDVRLHRNAESRFVTATRPEQRHIGRRIHALGFDPEPPEARCLDTADGFFLLHHDPMYVIYRMADSVVEVLVIATE